ncbi:MAG: dihydroorotase [SAR86 cluster bacterium]|uniref:Dihydroorotase n=1 Tax=SAR86 cluster bacterium TaxID=2030880 RepID=A0A2A4WT18_9GAMM|nr:MAG: dihydroorotase [SAR86 cluster bacterium]
MSLTTLSITQPDDWHLHLRDGEALKTTVAHSARVFARAIVMPNLKSPVTTVAQALSYRQRIVSYVPEGSTFDPLMTLYLTDQLNSQEVQRAHEEDCLQGIKFYPAGATTNSESGVAELECVYPALEKMAEIGLPLLIHGEVTDAEIDIFDRERVFLETVLAPLIQRFPSLKIILEHITTKDAVDFVTEQGKNIAATITPHHLLLNRNDLLVGGVRPHFYCLPILKRNTHQHALVKAATSGSSKFFLGTDSAPHSIETKEASCGCAGIYSAHAALELYTEVFEAENALDKLEGFASFFGADYYNLPRNQTQIILSKTPSTVPKEFLFGSGSVIPMRANESISWSVEEATQ